MCDDAEFIDVTIDLVLVMFHQGTYTFRDGSFGVGVNVASTREPPATVISSERLFGAGR
jgi:hypothetical protein